MIEMLELQKINNLRKETLEIIEHLMDASKAAAADGYYDVAEERLADVRLLIEWVKIGDKYFDKLREETYEEIQRLIEIEEEEQGGEKDEVQLV